MGLQISNRTVEVYDKATSSISAVVDIRSGRSAATEPVPAWELSVVTLVPMQLTTEPSFPLTHPYVELVYGPMIGPTAVLLARHLARRIDALDGPVDVDLAEVALDLGLRSKKSGPMGKRSPLRKALDRIEHVRFVRWLDADCLGVSMGAPAVSLTTLRNLPDSATRAHSRYTCAHRQVGA